MGRAPLAARVTGMQRFFFRPMVKNSRKGFERDLFGFPIEPLRDRRGRPSFAKSKENQDFVAIRAARGWSHKRIAEELGCDDDTLRKHFSGELERGALIVEGLMLDVLMQKLRQGHIPSIRMLKDLTEEAAPAAPKKTPAKLVRSDADETEVELPLSPTGKPGKKEERLINANDTPDDWGDIDDKRRGGGSIQ